MLFYIFNYNNTNTGYEGSTVINGWTFLLKSLGIISCTTAVEVEIKHCNNLRRQESENLNQSLYILRKYHNFIIMSGLQINQNS